MLGLYEYRKMQTEQPLIFIDPENGWHKIIIDYSATQKSLDIAHDIFDTIPTVENRTRWWTLCLT